MGFSAIFAPIFDKFNPWTKHKKRKDTCILDFPGRVLGLSFAPLKFSVENNCCQYSSKTGVGFHLASSYGPRLMIVYFFEIYKAHD